MLAGRDFGRKYRSSPEMHDQYLDHWLDICDRPRLKANLPRLAGRGCVFVSDGLYTRHSDPIGLAEAHTAGCVPTPMPHRQSRLARETAGISHLHYGQLRASATNVCSARSRHGTRSIESTIPTQVSNEHNSIRNKNEFQLSYCPVITCGQHRRD